jgi:flavin reductase (DIM6/NTAB) family NADH-FMN oxidoreductase RutF
VLFDFADLAAPDRYRLLTAAIVPRPIAWVVTLDPAGRRNAAPFSFFNAFGEDPPVVCLGIGPTEPGPHKDTGANIRGTGAFVVNLVPEALMRPMHVTAIPFPPEVDEIEQAGLTTRPSVHVPPPRIAESPVAIECRLHTLVDLGTDRTLAVGLVLAMHVADEAVVDAARCRIDSARLGLVGRVHGPSGYVRTTGEGVFQEARLTLADWARRG